MYSQTLHFSSHIDLLNHVKIVATEQARKAGWNENYKIGVHAIESMEHVHFHGIYIYMYIYIVYIYIYSCVVISQDFVSEKLRNKKHFNSFTSEFFIEIDSMIKLIEDKGKILIDKVYIILSLLLSNITSIIVTCYFYYYHFYCYYVIMHNIGKM